MATTYEHEYGSIVGGYGRLYFYIKQTNNSTSTTLEVDVCFWSKYSVSDSNNELFFNDLASSGSATTSLGSKTIKTTDDSGSGWDASNAKTLYTYSKTYTRGTSAQTRYLYAKLTGIDRVGGTMTVSTTVAIPKLDSYTVTYNTNGGSGAPSSQTKWYGKALTLSSTKPTRTGYSFQGWGTSASGSVVYAAGASYTANASDTLYAIWKADTYTVTYNANGGSGAPGNQTKTYGTALTLSSTKPTRTNYTFKGWGTSASATTVAYAAGASYTKNAAITLYAIWTLNYTKPRITSFSAKRCTSDGTASDEGTYALVKFSWACDKSVTSVKIEWKTSSGSSWSSTTVSSSGTSGSVSQIIGAGALSTENTYDIRVTVADGSGDTYTSTKSGTLEGTKFVIDLKSGGDGIAFGKPAELSDYMDVGFKSRFRDSVVLDKSTVVYALNKDNKTRQVLNFNNETEFTVLGYGAYAAKDADGNSAPVGGTNIYGTEINLYSRGNIVTSAPLHLTRTTDASGTADNNPALTIGPTSGVHLEFDGNEIMSKKSGTEPSPMYINADGGNVCINDNSIGSTYVRGCRIAENKVLWSGVYYMADTQTATLSEAISKQANGVVVVWSWYENGESDNSVFNSFFIPKHFVSAHNGKGIAMGLWSATANTFASKYLYVSDTSITGYVNNNIDAWTTGSGIKSTPKSFVLRYVIGV